MSKFSSKFVYLVAILCLALMVVALGAAAKHSQFESADHSTHYLKQSVKMVASSHSPAVEISPTAHPVSPVMVTMVSIQPKPVTFLTTAPVRSPLLI